MADYCRSVYVSNQPNADLRAPCLVSDQVPTGLNDIVDAAFRRDPEIFVPFLIVSDCYERFKGAGGKFSFTAIDAISAHPVLAPLNQTRRPPRPSAHPQQFHSFS